MLQPSSRAQAEDLKKQHPKLKHFNEELIAALVAFEKVQEWPDLIKCLGRVNKVLQRFSAVDAIPSLNLLAKRLAQCLNPGLPAGVHLKSLEVYSYILGRMGKDFLILNLGLFSAGLFPLLSYSSTRVRPVLLQIYEEFYLPLGHHLSTTLNGFLLALLPGIEDNTSETYDRAFKVLNRLKEASSPVAFNLSLWRCILLCPQARLAAVNYLATSIPKELDKLKEYLPARRSIAIEAIISTLHDQNVLAQRGMFEILISNFPIESDIFSSQQIVQVLHGILPVLLRKEASVNRRFFSWLMKSSSHEPEDDEKHVIQVNPKVVEFLVDAILHTMEEVSVEYDSSTPRKTGFPPVTKSLPTKDEATRPFHLVGILMERPEIRNSNLLELLNQDLISYAYRWNRKSIASMAILSDSQEGEVRVPDERYIELESPLSDIVLKAAQSFYRLFDISRVWNCIQNMVFDVFPTSEVVEADDEKRVEVLTLVDFALDFLPVQHGSDDGMVSHLSGIIERVLNGLYNLNWGTRTVSFMATIQFVLKMLQGLKSGAFGVSAESVHAFVYKFRLPVANEVLAGVPFAARNHGYCISSGLVHCKLEELKGSFDHRSSLLLSPQLSQNTLSTISMVLHLFLQCLDVYCCHINEENPQALQESVLKFSSYLIEYIQCDDPDLACIGAHFWIKLVKRYSTVFEKCEEKFSVVVASLWRLLSPDCSHYHVIVSELLLRLEKIHPDSCREITADSMLNSNDSECVGGYRKFAILWSTLASLDGHDGSFNHGMMLMLDALEDNRPPILLIARTWLQDSMSHFERVLDPLCEILLDVSTSRNLPGYTYNHVYDTRLVLYALQKLNSIILSDRVSVVENLSKTVSSLTKTRFEQQERISMKPGEIAMVDYDFESGKSDMSSMLPTPHDYLDLLVFIALRFTQGVAKSDSDVSFAEQVSHVRCAGVEFIRILISNINQTPKVISITSFLAEPILTALNTSVLLNDSMMQVQFLGLLKVIMSESRQNKEELQIFQTSLFSNTLLIGIQQAHADFHQQKYGNSANMTEESLSLLSHWVWFIVSSLKYLRTSLPTVTFSVVNIICQELQNTKVSQFHNAAHSLLLFGLAGVVHYCLFSGSDEAVVETSHVASSSQGFGPVSVLANIVGGMLFGSNESSLSIQVPSGPLSEAKSTILKMFPIVFESLVHSWNECESVSGTKHELDSIPSIVYRPRKVSEFYTPVGSRGVSHLEKEVKRQVNLLLEPIMKKFPKHVTAAFLHTWEKALSDELTDVANAEQHRTSRRSILQILTGLENAPPVIVINAVMPLCLEIIQSSDSHKSMRTDGVTPLKVHETAPLHFIDSYLQTGAPEKLQDAFPCVLDLVRHCAQVSDHPFTFLWLLGIIHQFVHRLSVSKLDKRFMKDLHDVVVHVIQTCAMFAGQSLHFSLAKDMKIPLPAVVNVTPSHSDLGEEDNQDVPPLGQWLSRSGRLEQELKHADGRTNISLVCLRALANVLAILIDNVWDDKDRVCILIQQVLPHLIPLFDLHGIEQMEHVRAASTILSSLSLPKFKYTTKAWKKEAWNHFMKPEFFLMDLDSMTHWRWVISRVVSFDQSVLQDLISPAQPKGLFTSHKSDVLARARQLKRLTFVIHSGRIDQYARYLSQIIEKLVESIKVHDADLLYTQVLFCIRVLLARISPEHLSPIWPIVISEIIRAFDEAIDLDLLLQACKFVDLALVILPHQFQIYQWMFVVDRVSQLEMISKGAVVEPPNEFRDFIPHLLMLSRRIKVDEKSGVKSPSMLGVTSPMIPDEGSSCVKFSKASNSGFRRPVLTMRKISNPTELIFFHETVCEWVTNFSFNSNPPDMEFIDIMLLCDFIEYGEEYENPLPKVFQIRKSTAGIPSTPSSRNIKSSSFMIPNSSP